MSLRLSGLQQCATADIYAAIRQTDQLFSCLEGLILQDIRINYPAHRGRRVEYAHCQMARSIRGSIPGPGTATAMSIVAAMSLPRRGLSELAGYASYGQRAHWKRPIPKVIRSIRSRTGSETSASTNKLAAPERHDGCRWSVIDVDVIAYPAYASLTVYPAIRLNRQLKTKFWRAHFALWGTADSRASRSFSCKLRLSR